MQGVKLGQDRAKLVVVEEVTFSTPLDPYLTLRALASNSGLSVRKLRDCLDDPLHPLPHYRVGGRVLVRRSEFDTWIGRHWQVGRADVERVVAEALQDL